MATITLPYATLVEQRVSLSERPTSLERDCFKLEWNYRGAEIGGVTVRHVGFVDPQPGYDPRSLIIDIDGCQISDMDLAALEMSLPTGCLAHRLDEQIVRLTRLSDPAMPMLPYELVPEAERDNWNEAANHVSGHGFSRYYVRHHALNEIVIDKTRHEPDTTLDERFFDYQSLVQINLCSHYGRDSSAQVWRLYVSGGYGDLHEEFRHIEPNALRGELDEPGRVWLSAVAMARHQVLPQMVTQPVVMPQSRHKLTNTSVRGRRSDWQRYGNTTGAQIEKLFQRNTLAEHTGQETSGMRALAVIEEDPLQRRFEWPETDMTPAPLDDTTGGFRLPVLGVKAGATGFTRYRPDRVWSHLRCYERNAFTWGGDRVFVHRGQDAWRFLFAFEDWITSSHEPRFAMLYCVPVIVQHSEVDLKRVVTFRGMPLDLQEAVWAVPGMSSALSHALNAVKFQLSKRVPLNYWGQRVMPKNHFAVALGAVHRSVLGYAAKNMFAQSVPRVPFEVQYGPVAGIADVFVRLFGLAGPSTLVQRVANKAAVGFTRGLELAEQAWETSDLPTGQIVTRCLDL